MIILYLALKKDQTMAHVQIGDREIGEGRPIFIMADLGLTNGGDLGRAKELIAVAADIGVDAVKFQMIEAERLLGDHSIEYTYPTLAHGPRTENMLEMFKGLEFSDEEWAEIVATARSHGIDIIITSHYEGAVARCNSLDLTINKICTWSLSHRRMIEMLAENGKPLMFDTGTITQFELLKLEDIYRKAGGGPLIVLHDFHTPEEEDMNFRAFEVYRQLGMVAGYTPQGRSDWLDYMSVGLGAKVLEKRLTLDRNTPANGHWKAHEPEEFKDWLANVRRCETALGRPVVEPTRIDRRDTKLYYKSAFLLRDVEAGAPIRQEDLEFKRPGHGVSSHQVTERLVGFPYPRAFKAGEMLEWGQD
ncbi:N-acetylneuraminate synthase family protein [Ruegeria sp. ANG-S4]|uniref:N-acetylneuraminate synthase family protein n=1 Tax=Ruegeria sp. ANG-S4 TaxID=1577904 RepID=UPI00126A19D0|nr:N-acetylneuraminate synthase family protein [Ruegeria sp. ANG-S4]